MSSKGKFTPVYFQQEDYLTIISQWKDKGQKIVFTNGCFDIIHAGHVEYLNSAAQLGNKLVVGLNSDSSVRLLKGKDRPINTEQDRGKVLSALYMIDLIIIFSEETPIRLIDKIDPDYLVKGGDYKIEDIVGADLVKSRGKEVRVMPEKVGYSTTRIISEMRK